MNGGVKLGVIVTCWALAAGAAAADHTDGGQPAAFALLVGSGRTLALGGAGVALDGLDAASYNPAAYATARRDTISASYRALSFDRRLVEVAYGRALGEGGAGGSWANASVDDLTARSDSGVEGEKIRNSQNLFLFGFARPVGLSWLAAGVGGRLYYTLLEEESASGYGMDAGVRAGPWPWLTVAAAAHDAATRIRWSTAAAGETVVETVPLRWLAGAAVRPWSRLVLAAQADAGRGEDWRFRGGVEFWADERLALRAGLDDGAPTLGAAVRLPRPGFDVTFDYAYVEEPFTSEAAHTVTLGLTL
jgi:hypothetical protein